MIFVESYDVPRDAILVAESVWWARAPRGSRSLGSSSRAVPWWSCSKAAGSGRSPRRRSSPGGSNLGEPYDLERYPEYELMQPMQRAYSSNVRGLSNLPIALEPAASP